MISGRGDRTGGIVTTENFFIIAVDVHAPNHFASFHIRAKGYKAYQPINSYWFEQSLLIHSEFRDGNVNAGLDVWLIWAVSRFDGKSGRADRD
jgi:hypothetical protein